jgi:hypothetical protein
MRPKDVMAALLETPGVKRRRELTTWRCYQRYYLELAPAFRFKMGPLTPFLVAESFSPQVSLDENETDRLEEDLYDYIHETGEDICVAVIGSEVPSMHRAPAANAIPKPFAVVDSSLLRALASEKSQADRVHAIGRAIARQLGILRLSPYDPDEKAERGSFFGRSEILKDILGGAPKRGYTIVGPRRIGKTSLLGEIRARLSHTYAESKVLRTAHVMAAQYQSTTQILSEIAGQLLERHAAKESYKMATRAGRAELQFKRMLRDLARDHRVAIFIDEVDYILELDAKQGDACISLLRAACDDAPKAQVFLAGFRHAFRARYDNRHPLYGFTDFKELGPLTQPECHEMIARPLADMGVPIEQKVIDRMWHESAGHPQVITYFCREYVKYFDHHRRAPDDAYVLTHILAGAEMRRRMTQAFFANANNLYEELLCLLLMRKALRGNSVRDFEFDLKVANELLQEKKINLPGKVISAICQSMRLCSIIQEVKGTHREQFSFTIPQLVRFFDLPDLDFYIQKAAQEIRQRPPSDNPYAEGSGNSIILSAARGKGAGA